MEVNDFNEITLKNIIEALSELKKEYPAVYEHFVLYELRKKGLMLLKEDSEKLGIF